MKKLNQNQALKLILALVIIIALCGLSFWGGKAFQENNVKAGGPGMFGPKGMERGMRRGAHRNIGNVTAVSSSSISLQTHDGNTKTFNITSTTKVTDNGADSSVSNIKAGDSVLVRVSATNTNQATQILLNPSADDAPTGGPMQVQSN